MRDRPPELELATERLMRVLERAEADIDALLAATQGASARRARTGQRGAIRAILAALVELLNPEAGDDTGPLWEVIRAAYRTGSERALESLPEGADRSLGGPHLEAARILFDNLAASMDDAIAYVGRRADDVFRRQTLEELTVSQFARKTRGQTAGALERNLRGRGVTAFRDRRGAEWRLSTYAEMAVLTASREAHTQATVNRLVENGMDLVRVSKSPESCDLCKRYEGKVYSITGTTEGYPALEDAPPYHPRCSHFLTGYSERLAS